MQILNLHLISDYSRKTVRALSEAVQHRFHNIEIKEYFWPLIKDKDTLLTSIEKIKNFPGIV